MQVILKNVRLAFPAIFEAKTIAGSDAAKFSAAFLFDKNSQAYKDVLAAQTQVAKEKWAAKVETVMKALNTTPDKLVLKNGDSKAEYEGYEGNFFVNSSNAQRPTVIDRDRSPLTEADGKPYAGCYVNAIIDVWAQDNQYGKRINASLKGIQFVKDGDAFAGGGVAAADDFEDMGDGADANNDLE
jgi:hypothetical protein